MSNISYLQGLDLYGLMVPAEHGGADLLNTEVLRLFQELGVNLTLAELFTMNELMCTKAIVKQGSEAQKAAYLEKISTGELWTSYCISEGNIAITLSSQNFHCKDAV